MTPIRINWFLKIKKIMIYIELFHIPLSAFSYDWRSQTQIERGQNISVKNHMVSSNSWKVGPSSVWIVLVLDPVTHCSSQSAFFAFWAEGWRGCRVNGPRWAEWFRNRLIRSSVCSFALTTHSFACSGQLASLAPSAALTRSLARSLRSLPRSWESEL